MQSVPKVAIRSQGAPRVTQVEVTRTCGHVEMLEVRGDPARSAFLDNARLRVCGKCYRESQTERDAAAVNEGKRCALEGSERQIAWAQSIRQKRAVEFGNALNDATAWAKGQIEKGGFTVEFGKSRTKTVQAAISDLFMGKVTWVLLDQDGQEFAARSHSARWWIDTREIEPRDMIASLLPQYRWEAYRDWEPLFRDEAPPEEEHPFEVDEPAPAPASEPAAAKPAPKAQVFDDDDVPF
jgi:hypothetical protein